MYYGETLAIVETWYHNRDGTGEDRLLVSDNEIAVKTIARGHSKEIRMASILAMLWLLAEQQVAVAHVPGDECVAHGPSHGPHGFVVHRADGPGNITRPQWSTAGVATVCGIAWRGVMRAAARHLPCLWVSRLEIESQRDRPCVEGCSHTPPPGPVAASDVR